MIQLKQAQLRQQQKSIQNEARRNNKCLESIPTSPMADSLHSKTD